jgi:hypothetical protein
MTMNPFANKFRILGRLAKVALLAVPLLAAAAASGLLHGPPLLPELCMFLALVAVCPCLIYAYVLIILHWKARYRGSHSDLWGILLLLEASGWFKLVYLFRHLLPDMYGRGRYVDTENTR